MKKDRRTVLTEYVRNLSEEDIKFLNSRLIERLSNDLSEVLNFISRNKNIDDVFRSASGANDLYDLCDLLRECSVREYKKRNQPRN